LKDQAIGFHVRLFVRLLVCARGEEPRLAELTPRMHLADLVAARGLQDQNFGTRRDPLARTSRRRARAVPMASGLPRQLAGAVGVGADHR